MNSMKKSELTGSDAAHPATGTVVIDGNRITLEDVKITEAPDGRVILTNDHDEPSGIRVGPLQGFTGTHTYEIPAGVNPDDYDSVTIWCDQFSVPIGLAKFA
jgi:hypothetical protein